MLNNSIRVVIVGNSVNSNKNTQYRDFALSVLSICVTSVSAIPLPITSRIRQFVSGVKIDFYLRGKNSCVCRRLDQWNNFFHPTKKDHWVVLVPNTLLLKSCLTWKKTFTYVLSVALEVHVQPALKNFRCVFFFQPNADILLVKTWLSTDGHSR